MQTGGGRRAISLFDSKPERLTVRRQLLTRVQAVEFTREATNGKTKPSLIVCEAANGSTVQLVAKFSSGAERGVSSLAIEMVAACLASTLSLPIPEPYLVEWTQDWADTLSGGYRAHVMTSSPLAFGSTLVTGQLVPWTRDNKILDSMIPVTAAVFAFDAWIENVDRRDGNPNCIVRGDEIRIFDHDLAFPPGPIIGQQPPWRPGALQHLQTVGKHIFWSGLKGRPIDYTLIRSNWVALSDLRLDSFAQALPAEWRAGQAAVNDALQSIRDVRENIDGCIAEMQRVLA